MHLSSRIIHKRLKSIAVIFYCMFCGVCKMNARSEEFWPKQPSESPHKMPNLVLGTPPYSKGNIFMLPTNSLFFSKRSALDRYKNDHGLLEVMINSGEIIKLNMGRLLRARESIISYEGQVTDSEFGDGYIVIRHPF